MKAYGLALAMAGALAGVAFVSTPAVAQDDEITVRPYTIQRHRVARSATGAREEVVSLSRPVAIDDLNLRYDSDVMEMERRINVTARDVCHELDRATFHQSSTSDRQCVREAVYDAVPQAKNAVARARY